MKSAKQAERTRNNLCNNSSAKSQFTFGREIRFKERNRKRWQIDSFYNLPSQMSRQGGVIGGSKRDFQKDKPVEGPSPDRYNPHEIKPDANIVFAPGRDVYRLTFRNVQLPPSSTTPPSHILGPADTTPGRCPNPARAAT